VRRNCLGDKHEISLVVGKRRSRRGERRGVTGITLSDA
jgi:hypothetical protein